MASHPIIWYNIYPYGSSMIQPYLLRKWDWGIIWRVKYLLRQCLDIIYIYNIYNIYNIYIYVCVCVCVRTAYWGFQSIFSHISWDSAYLPAISVAEALGNPLPAELSLEPQWLPKNWMVSPFDFCSQQVQLQPASLFGPRWYGDLAETSQISHARWLWPTPHHCSGLQEKPGNIDDIEWG